MTSASTLALLFLGVALYGSWLTALQPPDRSGNRRVAVALVGAAIFNVVATVISWQRDDYFALSVSSLSAVVLILLGSMLARAK